MPIRVVPYTEDHVQAVLAFNARMQAGGTPWGWYTHPEDEWLPPRPGAPVWREHYVALDDDGEVHAAYALKPQEWWIHGEPVWVTDWQGPVSEGVIDPRHAMLGLRVLRDMLKRRPLLYSWGHGEDESRMLQMLIKMGWQMLPTPFCLRILRPHRFLRRNAYLRRSRGNRMALDALAWSGVGWLGLKALDAAHRLRAHRPGDAVAEVVPEFGTWADELWEAARDEYASVGRRDAETLNALMPGAGWPATIRLCVRRQGRVVGWAAVLDSSMRDDPRFGTLRLGSVVDAFARPADAADVVAVATEFLARRGVDLIVSNQSHPSWIEGFRRSGFLRLRDRRLLAISPELGRALAPIEQTRQGLHLTNMDGHGPRGL